VTRGGSEFVVSLLALLKGGNVEQETNKEIAKGGVQGEKSNV